MSLLDQPTDEEPCDVVGKVVGVAINQHPFLGMTQLAHIIIGLVSPDTWDGSPSPSFIQIKACLKLTDYLAICKAEPAKALVAFKFKCPFMSPRQANFNSRFPVSLVDGIGQITGERFHLRSSFYRTRSPLRIFKGQIVEVVRRIEVES